MRVSIKKTGFSDKVIFILGLTLAGVITFVIIAGVIMAVIKLYMSSNKRSVQIQSDLNNSLQSVPTVENTLEGDISLENTE